MTHLTVQIAKELYVAVERLGADPDLLSVVGSYGDTLDDNEVLALLRHTLVVETVGHEAEHHVGLANHPSVQAAAPRRSRNISAQSSRQGARARGDGCSRLSAPMMVGILGVGAWHGRHPFRLASQPWTWLAVPAKVEGPMHVCLDKYAACKAEFQQHA